MLNIIDKYEQVNFEKIVNDTRFTGTCNIKDNNAVAINIQIYGLENSFYRGNMSINESQEISISLNNISYTERIAEYLEIFSEIKKELDQLIQA